MVPTLKDFAAHQENWTKEIKSCSKIKSQRNREGEIKKEKDRGLGFCLFSMTYFYQFPKSFS